LRFMKRLGAECGFQPLREVFYTSPGFGYKEGLLASNSFGKVFRMTTWGESHGKAVGVVIDGCPSGIPFNEKIVNASLSWRAPGKSPYTSPRQETDHAEIYSGVFDGKTTGAPISILIPNVDADSKKYEPIKDFLRPGHANYPYLQKYGVFDYRGGGRASGRETVCRVAAGSLAKTILTTYGIRLVAYLKEIGGISAIINPELVTEEVVRESLLFCPDEKRAASMAKLLEKTKARGDSLGGIVEVIATNLPAGLGDPIYEKLEATLSSGLMSIPAAKGIEIGAGFQSASTLGSIANDCYYIKEKDVVCTKTNYSGGIIAGIATGMPVIARVAFKPTSSIAKKQTTVTRSGDAAVLELPKGSRHDPCIAIRAVPVVQAMTAIVLVDALLYHRLSRIENGSRGESESFNPGFN